MRIFKAKWFTKFVERETISDGELKEVVRQAETGQVVNLGGDVFKIRLARAGEGKSGGYRLILFFRQGEYTFFEYAYPKSKRDNISDKDLKRFKILAKTHLALTDKEIKKRIEDETLSEIL
ncbi:addiction module toxin RelE [Spirochaetia bacterium]|nr:addiction module toxin RelE [Spirochaetia bacterium]